MTLDYYYSNNKTKIPYLIDKGFTFYTTKEKSTKKENYIPMLMGQELVH